MVYEFELHNKNKCAWRLKLTSSVLAGERVKLGLHLHPAATDSSQLQLDATTGEHKSAE
jgi:hypothetical protein